MSEFYTMGAKFTIHVYDLWKNGFFAAGRSPLDNYPIWNESYREYLNDMIIEYFMSWEIGQETEQLFWFALHSKMMEIMPRLNVLFKSRHLDDHYDPLQDHDYTIEHTEEGTLDTLDKDTDEKVSQEVIDDDTTEKKSSKEIMDDDTTEHKTSHETMTDVVDTTGSTSGTYDTITRDSDTPQQDLQHLGYELDDTWINKWLSHGQIVNNRHSDSSTAHSSETRNTDYTHDIAGTDDRTTDYVHDIAGTDDRTTDYNHTIQNDRTIDTDTTRHYLQHYSGRRMSGQDLALKLSQLAFDIETQLINALKPLFMGLYYD